MESNLGIVVYPDWIVQGHRSRDSRVIAGIGLHRRASCPYSDRAGKGISRSGTIGET